MAGVVAGVVVVPVDAANPLAEGWVVVVVDGAGVVAGVVTTSWDGIARGAPESGRVVGTGKKVDGVSGVEGVTVLSPSDVGVSVTINPLAGFTLAA